MMDLATAAAATGGRVRGANVAFLRVSTDSRTLEPGDLFVALAGERFDGHAFVAQARSRGAVAAMVATSRAAEVPGDVLVVDDPLAGLGRLAASWRARFTLPLVVVVGSNGKTTVKEMTAAALRAHFDDGAVLATSGNLNNAIGLPLTLLRLRESHRAAVIELGMNHRGETAELAPLAAPTIALVNNAQREHQEFMRSVAEVADEHADAIRALPAGGIAVINADDPHAGVWRDAAARAGARVVGFGTSAAADVRAEIALRADGSTLAIAAPQGRATVELAAPGRHMAHNAIGAAAAALAAGASLEAVARGLRGFRPVAGRLAVARAALGATVIDDSYNANPDSVRAAIDVLAAAPAPRWLVLGDMGEVGDAGPAYHREIGAYAREAGVERLFATGPLSRDAVAAFGPRGRHFDDAGALAAALAGELAPGATVLVKGSRFMRMERVVAALVGKAPTLAAHAAALPPEGEQ
ncbi:MAG: UDP-N-acetylmuramoyl-tripeptide--D-alanyl-D-alanine ligase [Betaproteobacteria bacterium]|nr:UDP-N-acetylmuramoyl-tripeptide--D-alanyl-D-alanine ligase [Betaproteobacteria bacterium]